MPPAAPLRALHVPDVRDANPYQARLAAALRSEGVDVDHASSHLTPLTHVLPSTVRPHVLHLHWVHPFLQGRTRTTTRWRTEALPRVLTWVRRRGVPVVWTVHNLRSHEDPHPDLDRAGRRGVAQAVDALIVHCHAAARRVAEELEPRGPVHVVPHGPLHGEGTPPDRGEARARLDLPPDELVVLHPGKLRPYKGTRDLLEAWSRLDLDATLVVAGEPHDDAHRARLKAAADPGRVRFRFGFVPEAELQALVAASDAVALPYRRVLTSGTVHLARSLGRPVVAPRLGCLPEDLAGADTLLYDPHREAGLREALARLPHVDLAALGEATARAARGDTWREAGRRTHAVYREVVGSGSGGSSANRR